MIITTEAIAAASTMQTAAMASFIIILSKIKYLFYLINLKLSKLKSVPGINTKLS